MTEAFIWDLGTEKQRLTKWPETSEILEEIFDEIVKDNRRLIYSHKVRWFQVWICDTKVSSASNLRSWKHVPSWYSFSLYPILLDKARSVVTTEVSQKIVHLFI